MTKLRILLLFLWLVGISALASARPEMAWFSSQGNVFEVQAPSGWKQNKDSQYLSISSPDGSAAITANAYSKKGSSLQEFAEYRFSSVPEFYNPVTEVYKIKKGVVREYEGTWPGESKPTYYVVAAIKNGNIYISITVVTDRNNFITNKKLYINIFETVKIN